MWGCAPQTPAPWAGPIWLVIVIIAAAILFYLLRDLKPRSGSKADRLDSLKILKLRLAKGDITHEEYRRMRQVLEE